MSMVCTVQEGLIRGFMDLVKSMAKMKYGQMDGSSSRKGEGGSAGRSSKLVLPVSFDLPLTRLQAWLLIIVERACGDLLHSGKQLF